MSSTTQQCLSRGLLFCTPRSLAFLIVLAAAILVHEYSSKTTLAIIPTIVVVTTNDKTITIANETTAAAAKQAIAKNKSVPRNSWTAVWSSGEDENTSAFPCHDPGSKLKFTKVVEKRRNGTSLKTTTTFPLKAKPFWSKGAFVTKEVRPTHGMLFVKPMKVAGSTATGVQLRMSKNTAKRQDKRFRICENSYDHAQGRLFRDREKDASFLWSVLRNPTERAVSYFWHMFVSKGKAKATDDGAFVRILGALQNYYIYLHMLQGPSDKLIKTMNMTQDQQFEWIIQDILNSYDFIGITERLDESLIVMYLLMGATVPLGDMLFLSSKVHGGYDNRCNYLIPSNLTFTMKQYLGSEQWQHVVHWDQILYEAVNASLDSTIDTLGRPLVESTLQQFQAAQQVVVEKCQDHVKFGCFANGEKRNAHDTNCLFQDSACAYECIDQVAEELGLAG